MEASTLVTRPSRPSISENDTTPIVQIIAWLFLGIMLLSSGTRFAVKFVIARSLMNLDDLFALLALGCAIGQVTSTLWATRSGLGKASGAVSQNDLKIALRAELVADILFLCGLWAARISILSFLKVVTRVKAHHRVLWIAGFCFTIWMVTAVFATGFRCEPPDTWDFVRGKCFNLLAFNQYLGISNILIEIVVIVLPVMVILPLQTPWKRKGPAIASFSTRLLVVVAMIAQLVELKSWIYSTEVSLAIWSNQICVQVIQVLSIVTVSIPYMKPFLESLQVGALRTDNAATQYYITESSNTQTLGSPELERNRIKVVQCVEVITNVQ